MYSGGLRLAALVVMSAAALRPQAPVELRLPDLQGRPQSLESYR